MPDDADVRPPRATYRIQFQEKFGFDDAAAIAAYLGRLGISHAYASPYLKARPGSVHGYDIVDHVRLNPELGDDQAFARMVLAFRQNGIGQVLDFVPNHMGVGGADNPRWLDVLEWGPESAFAGWFDIDWDPDRRYLHNKLLVPFLGNQYGVELEAGRLRLKFDAGEGSFAVWAYDTHKLPVSPLNYHRILDGAHEHLEWLGDDFAGLPAWRPQVGRRAAELKQQLALLASEDTSAREAIDAAVARFNGRDGDFASWGELHALIQDQHWRTAHFRVAADDINYRRFFNINDLAGLRMELPDVFDHAHRLVFRLLEEGIIDGLRIDHIDGLLDPRGYLVALREKAPRRDFYLVVEKILGRHEALREDWPVEGTTGYEFTNLVLGLMIDPAGEEGLTQTYAEFTGETRSFAEIVREAKLGIMEDEMSSELEVLARDAGRVARQNPKAADFTRNILRRALREVIACFPVYRTYVDFRGHPAEADRRDLDWAIAQARRHQSSLDPSVFDFVHQLLTGDLVAQPQSGFSRSTALRCAMKFQQYSGPVMAKGLEDTAYYRYTRLLALNEVGGYPDVFGGSIAAFHRANQQRAERTPLSMLGTSTHDTKRGEDARARLAVLSEIPEEWSRAVQIWSRVLRARRGDVGVAGPPDRNDEYTLYQLLVSSWPVELLDKNLDAEALATYTERVKGALIKCMRERKVQSTWASPDQTYEDAALSFLTEALDPERAVNFLASFVPFAERVASLGVRNTIVQTTLKLTVPGVPDLYQGTELWDLSLVDPDNRRPVDYDLRKRMLEDVSNALATDRRAAMSEYMSSWRDGRFKLATVATLLDWRRTYPDLFSAGTYQPLDVQGNDSDQVCAFMRQHGYKVLISATVRFPARRPADELSSDTIISIPEPFHQTRWRDLISGVEHAAAAALRAEHLFAIAPGAVLIPVI